MCDNMTMTAQPETRSGTRRPLRLMVKSRVESRVVHVDMLDISGGGCRIKGTQGFAEVGDRVTMKVGGMHAPVGYIAWVKGREAGVCFDGEMHEAVLDHLCNAQVPDLARDPDTLRRI